MAYSKRPPLYFTGLWLPVAIITSILFFAAPFGTAAQPPGQQYIFNTRRLTVQNGLVHQEVGAVLQDSRGFMWLGTRFGLSRYDGFEFKSFTQEQRQLSNTSVDQILEDDAGNLWLFAQAIRGRKDLTAGIDLLNLTSGAISRFEDAFPGAPFTVKALRNYFSLPGAALFFDAGGKYWKYSKTTGFTPVQLPGGFVPWKAAGESGYWGVMDEQYVQVNKKGRIIFSAPVITRERPLSVSAGPDYLCVGAGKGYPLQVYGNAGIATPAVPGEYAAASPDQLFYDDQKQILWASWGRELLAFNKTGNLIYQLSNSQAEPVERVITGIMSDRSGLTWVITQAGVLQVSLSPALFTRYLYIDPSTARPNQRYFQCRGIYDAGNFLLINTYLGVYRVDAATGRADSLAELVNESGKKFAFRFPVYKDRNGRLLFGSNAVTEADPVTGRELKYYKGTRKRFWSLYRDRNSRLLIGSEKGLYMLGNGEQDTVTIFTAYNQFTELKDYTVLHITEDREGRVWLLTTNGVYNFDADKGITARYSTRDKGLYYLPADKIQHLHADSAGRFWLATEGAGLIRWNPKNGDYKAFGKADGLSSNNIYAVYEDRHGFLWLSSDYGIMRFQKQTGQVTVYTPDDGLTHYEFNRISHHQSAAGRLYFGGLNGVTAFYPDAIDSATGFDIHTGVAVAGLQQLRSNKGNLEDVTEHLLKTGRIVLRPSDKFFILKLAAPEYMYSEKTVFWYKVEGLDKEWTRNTGNSIRIGRLPFGSYTLLLKAQLSNGNTTAETRIPLIVKRPVYLRWWFFVLAALLVALGVRWFYRWRIRQLKHREQELETTVAARTRELEKDKAIIEKQATELKQLDEMKSAFFANVSHELRTPLTLLTGPVNRLLQQTSQTSADYGYLQLMQQNVVQLQNRVNEILDLSKLDAGKLELKEDVLYLEKFLQPVMASFESLAQQKNISFLYRCRTAPNLAVLTDGENLKKILNNLLSNAFKFTPSGGQVLVTVHDNIGQLVFKVADTGTGIHPDEQQYIFNRFYQAKTGGAAAMHGGTGIGLALTAELVALMKGRIHLESEPGRGATFIVELPRKMAPASVVAIEPAAATAQPAAAVAPKAAHKGAHILLVEDNTGLQQYIQMELRDYRLTIAANGAEALHLLEQVDAPHLIISDIMMPVMDGFALLEKLKGDDRYRKIPVIMLTARAEIHDKLAALRIGVDDYLVKPFVTEELVARMNNLLERYSARNNAQWLNEADEAAGPTGADEPAAAPPQPAWLHKLEQEVLGFLNRQEAFTLDTLAAKMYISKRQLQRNIKEEAGMTANTYIREMRLHRARLYLEEKKFATLAELSYAVGFNDPHYFSTLFTERYGKKPGEYL